MNAHALEPHEKSLRGGQAHARPQAPQFSRSLAVLLSQPDSYAPSQSEKPSVHASAQVAPMHVAAALSASGQRVPHVPQLSRDVARGTSQPFAGLPSQSLKPDAHVVRQTPALQRAVAFVPATHAVPHVPQLVALAWRSTHAPLQRLWPGGTW